MMDPMISMFIDKEMDLKDQINFVNRVFSDRAFKDQTIALLKQEQFIRSDVVDQIPVLQMAKTAKQVTAEVTKPIKMGRTNFFQKIIRSFTICVRRPTSYFASAMVAAIFMIYFFMPSEVETQIPYRFIIYMPDAKHAEITGSFTNWQNFPMKKAGNMGYWEITLKIPAGEHRFSYLLDGNKRCPDPTLPAREVDDFGGENSILSI